MKYFDISMCKFKMWYKDMKSCLEYYLSLLNKKPTIVRLFIQLYEKMKKEKFQRASDQW